MARQTCPEGRVGVTVPCTFDHRLKKKKKKKKSKINKTEFTRPLLVLEAEGLRVQF